MSFADDLQDKLETDGRKDWPLKDEQAILEDVAFYRALRQSDAAALKPSWWDADWQDTARTRPYLVDPLPERVSGAFGDLIFGEEPEFTAASESDQDRLDDLAHASDLPTLLQSAADMAAAEGEAWWRILVDRDVSDQPLIEFHSRLAVVPLLRSGHVLACAFVTTLRHVGNEDRRMRYVELHDDHEVRNLLFDGATDKLGDRVALTEHGDVADLPDVWVHELGMLAGRVMPVKNRTPLVGRSVYAGKTQLFQALNEATTVGHENMELTAKRRAVVPASYLDRNGRFPAGADIIVATQTDQTMGKGDGTGLSTLEWSFDAEALEVYKSSLIDTALTRCRVAPQLLGRHTEGAQTGPALRARLLDSVLAANGMARAWDDKTPIMLERAQRLSALSVEQGGFGVQWAKPGEPPAMTRASVLPVDEDAQTIRHATAVVAEIESRETAIRDMRPQWSETQIAEELSRITAERESVLTDVPPPHEDGVAETG